jgi:hypothetical protein
MQSGVVMGQCASGEVGWGAWSEAQVPPNGPSPLEKNFPHGGVLKFLEFVFDQSVFISTV